MFIKEIHQLIFFADYSSIIPGKYTRDIGSSLNSMKKRILKTNGQELSCNKEQTVNGHWNK